MLSISLSTPLVDTAGAVGSVVVAVVVVSGAGASLLVSGSIVLRVVRAAGSIGLLFLSLLLSTVNLMGSAAGRVRK